MKRDGDKKEPLFRKEKKTGLQTRYYVNSGGEARWSRHTKKTKQEAAEGIHFKPMNPGKHGYDYTPLYRFLHSREGRPFDEVYAEVKSRLDKEEPIWWMVRKDRAPGSDLGYVALGENSFWRTMFVDEEGLLQFINKEAKLTEAYCNCHTHSFDGKQVAARKEKDAPE